MAGEFRRASVLTYTGPNDAPSKIPSPSEPTQPYRGPWNRVTSAPILVINSRFDPSTPLKGAKDGINELAKARLLVVEGSGHSTMYVHSTCAEKAKRDYLISGVLPAEGTTCAIDHQPFDPA